MVGVVRLSIPQHGTRAANWASSLLAQWRSSSSNKSNVIPNCVSVYICQTLIMGGFFNFLFRLVLKSIQTICHWCSTNNIYTLYQQRDVQNFSFISCFMNCFKIEYCTIPKQPLWMISLTTWWTQVRRLRNVHMVCACASICTMTGERRRRNKTSTLFIYPAIDRGRAERAVKHKTLSVAILQP